MEKVKVKLPNPKYNGVIAGHKFFNGVAENVPLFDAEYMHKQFGYEIIKPEQPKPKTEKKQPAKKTAKKTSTKKGE